MMAGSAKADMVAIMTVELWLHSKETENKLGFFK
jgi:hypothetical protein